MIDALRVSKVANFQRLRRPLSNASVEDLFRRIRANHPSASQNVFYHRRDRANDASWSAVAFQYDRSPSFIQEEAGVRDRVYGFILLVEYRSHIAIFKSKLDIPAAFSTRFTEKIPAARVDAAIARSDAVFQKIRLRNMSVSKNVMRNKTFEADDLRNVVGPAGASRYVPQGYSVRSGDDHYSATPSTGRIAQRSDRVGHSELIEYAKSVIDNLIDIPDVASKFIQTFARSIDLINVRGKSQPTSFAIDTSGLLDAIYERREIRLVQKSGASHLELSKRQIASLVNELDVVMYVTENGKSFDLQHRGLQARAGKITINKSRIALKELLLPLSSRVEVEDLAHLLGRDPNRMSLRQYLNRHDKFIVLFEDLSLAYIDGTLFRDEGFVDGGTRLMRYLRADPRLDQVVSEKGGFLEDQAAFDHDSTFGVVVASVASEDSPLVCDDLGDEWADFIGINNKSSPPLISFYHAKHGDLSLGAGSFHISVSQAIKNLKRMELPIDAMPAKLRRWRSTYRNAGVRTSIPRLVRGNVDELSAELDRVRSAPDATRRVFIVTSSLSRKAVNDELASIASGKPTDPYFVQLYWLLMSFFSACVEMNANGYIVCRT